ncbi:MAG: carotenoid biosynthesis protein [Anaerolineae bacterium]|nr:carotenoid biosynthesis protein [Anaerolineae bacterium]MBL6965036.1 carotenoid biosynthesis protein [Anaerolineales bacterium]
MRRLTLAFFWAYTALTVYIYARLFAGYHFQLWAFFLHPVLAFAFSLLHAIQREGKARAALLVLLTTVMTLFAESMGVATGLIFGQYHYNDNLGPLFLGLVPYVIPMVWFYMMYPAYVIAERILPQSVDARWRAPVWAAVTGGIMLSWDLVLDPVMVYRSHWVWDQPGAYFGIPLQNFWGWWLTTFVTIWLYLKINRRILQKDTAILSESWAVWGFGVMALGTVLSAIYAGLWSPALIGGLTLLFWVILAFARSVKFG